jgi:hypothetical protein
LEEEQEMAKKSRRARLSPTQRYMPTPGAAPDEAAPVARPTPMARAAQAVTKLGQNPEDYTHIRADLARIGILAGSILAVLLALRLLAFR